MKNVNLTLRQAYHALIANNITLNGDVVPLFFLQVPDQYYDFYIVINSIGSTDAGSSKCGLLTDSNIQFTIYSRLERNSGYEVDLIADQLFTLVFPSSSTIIPGTLSIELVNDIVTGGLDASSNKQVVERVLTFNHKISHFS